MDLRNRLTVGKLSIASFGRPCLGEHVSGDGSFIAERDGKVFLAILDGLGHGVAAHEVARQAERLLALRWSDDLPGTLGMLHDGLRGSIGMATGLGVFDISTGKFEYVGVGNTVCYKIGLQTDRLFSREGIVGSHIPEPVVRSLHLGEADVLLLYTDGLSERIGLDQYPLMRVHSAPAIARNLVDRFGKDHDDATCMALRYDR